MIPAIGIQYDWLACLRRYVMASIAANFLWEVLQLPFFTLWSTGTFRQQSFAVIHCTLGDAMIASLSLLVALVFAGHSTWPAMRSIDVFRIVLAIGLAYTIYSEWLNTSVRGNWVYSNWMPVLPILGTGIMPLLQWLVVPSLAYKAAIGWQRRRV